MCVEDEETGGFIFFCQFESRCFSITIYCYVGSKYQLLEKKIVNWTVNGVSRLKPFPPSLSVLFYSKSSEISLSSNFEFSRQLFKPVSLSLRAQVFRPRAWTSPRRTIGRRSTRTWCGPLAAETGTETCRTDTGSRTPRASGTSVRQRCFGVAWLR